MSPGQRRRNRAVRPPEDRFGDGPGLDGHPDVSRLGDPAVGPPPDARLLTGPQLLGPQLTGPQLTGPPFTGPQLTGPPFTGPPFVGPPFVGPPFVGPASGTLDRLSTPGEDDDDPAPRAPRAPVSRGPLLPVLSVLLTGWSLTCLIDLDRPRTLVGMLAAVAALSPLAAASAVLVGALALRGRRWITAGIAVVAALLPWLFALPYAVPAATASGRTTQVRVLVVNAREGRADPKDIAATVRTQAVDLLVITELTSRLAHDLTNSGIDGRLVARWVSVPPIAARGTAAQAGLGIWSRFTMAEFAPVPGTRWPAVRAKLETGHGKLTVVAGHVVPPTLLSSGSWSTDLAALHKAGDVPGPVTVLGGLNGTPWNPQFRAAAGGGLHDAGDVLGRGIRPTWPSWLGVPLLPLDHALVGGGVGVQSLVGATIDGTDHRALLVSLLVPDGQS